MSIPRTINIPLLCLHALLQKGIFEVASEIKNDFFSLSYPLFLTRDHLFKMKE